MDFGVRSGGMLVGTWVNVEVEVLKMSAIGDSE
jgi:hypothetical protein